MGNEVSESELKGRERLPIFISYGHQSHEETVLKIKDALEARGHKIWIDTEGIRAGTDWRRKIFDGILNSRLFLAFVSKKSIESEYCQTEIRIAVGAPKTLLPVCPLKLENVKVPQSISHIQTVNFVYDENDPSAFEKGLKQIIDWIDLPEHEAYCREMEELREKLGRPESFEARLGVLMSQPFVGRQWLLEKINEWDKGDSRLFGIIGGPGFGKSIFAANLRSLAPHKVAAAQFIAWDQTTKYAPKQIIKSLAFQLAARITQYRELLIDAVKNVDLDSLDEGSLFAKLLSEPLVFENPNNTYWVILDALDEATSRDGQNPFVQTLMRNMTQLPSWLKFIVTSRPDAAVVTYLKNRGIQLFDTDSQIRRAQHDDMMEYLRGELKDCRFGNEVLEGLISKSQGMFLYLHFVCRNILQNHLSAEDISLLPAGIENIYQDYFDRQFKGDRYPDFISELRPVLRLYRSALEPLPLDFIAKALDRSVEDVHAAVDKLGTLKNYTSENGRDYFNLVHKSIWDWLAAQPNDSTKQTFLVAPKDGLPVLTEFCLKKIGEYDMKQLVKDNNYDYPLRYVIRHLVEQKNENKIWELLGGTDPQLPKLQKDYFGSYAASVDSLKTAILYYLELYRSGQPGEVLSRVCRLMVTLASLQAEQLKELKNVFAKGNTLQQTLDYMDSIQDVKVYYIIGCYLLTKVEDNHWDMGQLISAIEKRCTGNIKSLNKADRDFLAQGIFPKIIKRMSVEQIIRLLRIFSDHDDACNILDDLKDQMNLPQTARAYWYFEKLALAECRELGDCSNPEKERERIQALANNGSRCEELLKLAENCYVHDDRPGTEKSLDDAVKLLKDAAPAKKWKNCLEEAAELYWNMGKTAGAGKLILDHQNLFGINGEHDFIIALCKYGLPEKAYEFFETNILPVPMEASDIINRFGASETITLLETLIQFHKEKTAAELLKSFCSREGNEDCLFSNPKLLTVMRKLRESGVWNEKVPNEKELKAEYLKRHKLKKLAEYIQIQNKDFSPAFQLELIRDAWTLFTAYMEDSNLSAKEKAAVVNSMNKLLTFNTEGLKNNLGPDVGMFLNKLKELSKDHNLFFYHEYKQASITGIIERWLTGNDTLLYVTLEKEKIAELVNWLDQAVSKTLEIGNNDDTSMAGKALFSYYIVNGMSSETFSLLKNYQTDTEKLSLVFEGLRDLLKGRRFLSKTSNIPFQGLENVADGIDAVLKSCNQKKVKLDDIDYVFADFLNELQNYQGQEVTDRICSCVWRFLEPIFDKLCQDDMYMWVVSDLLKGGAWSMNKDQFSRWFGKLRRAAEDEDNGCVVLEDCLAILIELRTGKEHLDENWHQDILTDLPKIKDLGDRNEVLTKLFVAAVRKGTPAQQQEILARMSNTVLIGNSRELRVLDLEKLYGALTGGNISDALIHAVVKDMNWKELDFDKLCLIAPHMLDEKEYMERWFPALFRKLQEDKDLEAMETIIRECPELGLPVLPSDEPEKKTSGSALTLDMIAGMVPSAAASPLAEQIMELRKQLAEENITPKGYKLGMEKLLAALQEEKKQQIAALEQALNDELITEKGFASKLSEILG